MKLFMNSVLALAVSTAFVGTYAQTAVMRSPQAGTAYEAGMVSALSRIKGMEPVIAQIQAAQAKGNLNITNMSEVTEFLNGIRASLPPALQAQIGSQSVIDAIEMESNALVSSGSDFNPSAQSAAQATFATFGAAQKTETCEIEAIGNGSKVSMTEAERQQAQSTAESLDSYIQTLVVSGKLPASEVPAFRDRVKSLYGVANPAALTDGSLSAEESAQLSAGLKILAESLASATAVRAALNGELTIACSLFDAYKMAAAGKGQTGDALSASAAGFVTACGETFGAESQVAGMSEAQIVQACAR